MIVQGAYFPYCSFFLKFGYRLLFNSKYNYIFTTNSNLGKKINSLSVNKLNHLENHWRGGACKPSAEAIIMICLSNVELHIF